MPQLRARWRAAESLYLQERLIKRLLRALARPLRRLACALRRGLSRLRCSRSVLRRLRSAALLRDLSLLLLCAPKRHHLVHALVVQSRLHSSELCSCLLLLQLCDLPLAICKLRAQPRTTVRRCIVAESPILFEAPSGPPERTDDQFCAHAFLSHVVPPVLVDTRPCVGCT